MSTQFWHGTVQCPVCEEEIPYTVENTEPSWDYPGDTEVLLDMFKHPNCTLTGKQEFDLHGMAIRHEGECQCQRDHK